MALCANQLLWYTLSAPEIKVEINKRRPKVVYFVNIVIYASKIIVFIFYNNCICHLWAYVLKNLINNYVPCPVLVDCLIFCFSLLNDASKLVIFFYMFLFHCRVTKPIYSKRLLS